MININAFFRVASQLAFQACNIIKEVAESPQLGMQLKGQNNPVTQADFKAQTMIIKALRSLWPTIKIVAEESVDYVGNIATSTNPIDCYQSTKSFFEGVEMELEVDRVCVWIDPLDGTYSFCEGTLDEVTVLIGLSYDNKAKLGVIGLPYMRSTDNKIIFQPTVFLGTVDSPTIYKIDAIRAYQKIELDRGEKQITILASKYRSERHHEFLESLSQNVIPLGGCGRKILKLLDSSANTIINLNNKSSRWDICAGQALVRAMGGIVTNLRGEDLVYDPNQPSHTNQEGLVCVVNFQHLKIIVAKTNEFVIY